MKVLHLQLSEVQHERLNDEAHRNRTSMASLVRGWIDGIGSHVYREAKVESPMVGVGKVTSVETKSVVAPIPVQDNPKVDPKTCKHQYNKNMVCWKCGYSTKP